MQSATNRAAWILWGALAAVGFAGCGKPSFDKYVPEEAAARQAVETALTHWRDGQRPGTIASVSPAVAIVDSRWQAGQKLAAFQIVKQESADGAWWVTVRLTLRDPPAEQEVRYAVIGKDPLWVYREEDYKKLSGM
jgi:hypothetical protein